MPGTLVDKLAAMSKAQYAKRRRDRNGRDPGMFTRRVIRMAVAAAVVAAGTVAVQLATPATASARCVVGHPTTTDVRNENNVRVAWETPKAGTCAGSSTPGDGYYQGTLSAAAYWTPELYTQNGGHWVLRKRGAGSFTIYAATHQFQEFLCAIHNVTGARMCGTGGPQDQANAQFCKMNIHTGQITLCGHVPAVYPLDPDERPDLAPGTTSPDFGLLNSAF